MLVSQGKNPQVTETLAVEDSLSRIIPYSSQVADGVVLTRTGDFVVTWQVAGISFEGLSDADAAAELDVLNLLLRSLANGKFAFWIHRVRRRVTDRLEVPPEGFARDLMQRYYDTLASGSLVATELYISIVYRPKPVTRWSVLGKGGRTQAAIQQEFAQAFDVLSDIDRQLGETLRSYGPRRLRNYVAEGVTFCEQLEFLAFLLNGHWWRIPAKDVPLNQYIGLSRVLIGNELLETRDTYGSTFSTFVDLKDYADFTAPGSLTSLIGLNCEYVETHSYSPMAMSDAKAALQRQRGQLIASQDSSASQIAQIDEALDGLISGNFALGEYHYSLQVKGATPETCRVARSAAIEALQRTGFLGVMLDLIPAHAFAAQLPGNWSERPRLAKLSTRNFAGMCSLHNFVPGKRNGNPWGEAVAILRSPANQPVYVNFHSSPPGEDSTGQPELGNTQVIGKSRSGKTVLALFLAANLRKYDTQIIYFDKDRGAEIAIRAMGGVYLTMEKAKATGLAPFKMEPTAKTQLFWVDLIKFCSRMEGHPHTPKEEAEITQAVKAVAALPPHLRCFTTVIQNLPRTDANSVSNRLAKWVDGGNYGWALDCHEDRLNFDESKIYGLDYTEFLDDASVCPAIMMYLMHRIQLIMDGRRLAIFMDEYWKALKDPYFEDFAKNSQKVMGKLNAFGCYMTQSPSDTVASPIAKTLIEQTATFIFLPNPQASEDDYIGGFKVSRKVFELIRNLPVASRMCVIVQGEQVTLAKLDLHGFNDELKVLSSTAQNVRRLDGLRQRLGDAPADWLTPFMRGET